MLLVFAMQNADALAACRQLSVVHVAAQKYRPGTKRCIMLLSEHVMHNANVANKCDKNKNACASAACSTPLQLIFDWLKDQQQK